MKKDHNIKRSDFLRRRLHNTQQITDRYPEYIKNIYKSIKRQTPKGKIGKAYKQALHKRENLNHEYILKHIH